MDIALYEYSKTRRQEIVLDKVNPYEKSLQHALQCFQDGSESILSLEQALISLNTALELKSRLTIPIS